MSESDQLRQQAVGRLIMRFYMVGGFLLAVGYAGLFLNGSPSVFSGIAAAGAVLVAAPIVFIFSLMAIFALMYVITAPVRAWCHLRLRMFYRHSDDWVQTEKKLEATLRKLDSMGEWLWSW